MEETVMCGAMAAKEIQWDQIASVTLFSSWESSKEWTT